MQLLIITLDDCDEFLSALSALKEENMNGIVFPTTSLKHALLSQNNVDDAPIFGNISKLVTHDFSESHTVLMLVRDEKIDTAKQIIRNITKGIGHKGILFTVPVSYSEGLEL